MTTTMREIGSTSRRGRRRRVQDATALLLILVGMLGMVATSFAWHPLAGGFTLCTVLVGIGVYTGLD